ncbi:hypothetical protein GCM10027402_00270 [Arthrobacter monumenti]
MALDATAPTTAASIAETEVDDIILLDAQGQWETPEQCRCRMADDGVRRCDCVRMRSRFHILGNANREADPVSRTD